MTLWLPQSACGPDCLDGAVPEVGWPRRAGRLAALAGVMLGVALLLPALPLLPAATRERVVRAAARGVLRTLGVRVSVRGKLPLRRAMVVANHVSWLDIVVLLAVTRVRLVAKTEVRGWPLIGRVAGYAGTIFLDRSRPRTLPTAVAAARGALAGGAVVAVFPEGTTSCGRATGPFRPAFFQAALDAGTPVVPVTLVYRPEAVAAFVGDDTLLASIRRVLGVRGLTVRLTCGAAIHPAPGATRRALARLAGRAVGTTPPATPVPVRNQWTPTDSRTAPSVLRPAA